MTEAQLSLATGLPVFAIMMSTVARIMQSNALATSINARFTGRGNRFTGIEARSETLTGKVVEMDNRLTWLEALLDRH